MADLLQLGFEIAGLQLDLLGSGEGLEGQAAAQALLGLGAGGVHQAAHQIGGEQLLDVHALLGDLAGCLLQQVANFLLHQRFG